MVVPFRVRRARDRQAGGRVLGTFRGRSKGLRMLFSIGVLVRKLRIRNVSTILFLQQARSCVIALRRLNHYLSTKDKGRPIMLSFIGGLSNGSMCSVVTLRVRHLTYRPSPGKFRKIASFLAANFLSSVQLHVRRVLARLRP